MRTSFFIISIVTIILLSAVVKHVICNCDRAIEIMQKSNYLSCVLKLKCVYRLSNKGRRTKDKIV